jgi:hypothetical protein
MWLCEIQLLVIVKLCAYHLTLKLASFGMSFRQNKAKWFPFLALSDRKAISPAVKVNIK